MSAQSLEREIAAQISASIAMTQALLADSQLTADLGRLVRHCVEALRAGRKILIAGNGGSAADAQHFAGELVNRFNFDRPALCAIALTTDTSVITAIGNDYGYEHVFARQLAGLGQQGDVFIAISTSGKSPNVLAALRTARDRGLFSAGFSGTSGGAMRQLCDICLCVPSTETPRIQEGHQLLTHILCSLIEATMFRDGGANG